MNRLFFSKVVFGLLFLFSAYNLSAQQIVAISPPFATSSDNNVVLTYDASKGNAGLLGESVIYAHTGVITTLSTSGSDWKYVLTNWTTNLPKALLTRVGSSNLYTLNIGNIKTFYGVPANETVLKLALVFRNADGSKTGKTASGGDIFLDINQGGFQVKLNSPNKASFYLPTDSVSFLGTASVKSAIKIFANGTQIASVTNDSVISQKMRFSDIGSGRINIVLEGDNGITKSYDTSYIMQRQYSNVAVSPNGVIDGINYISDTSVTLQIFAPNKSYIYVIGDFTNWEYNPNYIMNRTPDGTRFWLTINGLTSGKEYGFQYSIDDLQMRVADVYADKVLDPNNDKWIAPSTYPNLMPYPTGKTTEIVSVLQTAQVPYLWKTNTFNKPKSEQLVIYELLLRDFIGAHDYKTLKDTISYLKRAGINCVQLMPIMEFEGNESWGYNTSFIFAPDKYYGTKNDLKAFIDACHQEGIAVVFDVVYNHSFGQNPQVRMYFDPTLGPYGQPTAQNPWFNQVDKHPYGVGYDYNHEAQPTKDFVDRNLKYWLTEYKIDGYRFDLSKGFTQKNTGTDVGAWNAFDQSRIDILNRIKGEVVKYAPDAYLILEHLGENAEEKILANAGFMLWGKMTENYAEALMGYNNSKANLSWGDYKSRTFANPNLVTYAESHDEERVMFTCLTYGNTSGTYSTKNLNTALKRAAAYHALLIPLRGPKMLWQGGELGYEVSINTNGRTGNKPFKWEYLKVPERVAVLDAVGELARLKQHVSFTSDNYIFSSILGTGKFLKVTHDSLNTIIVGNFDVINISMAPGFQHLGWWYNYMTGDSLNVTALNQSIPLTPGQYLVYTDKKLNNKIPQNPIGLNETSVSTFKVFPNPSTGNFYVHSDKDIIDEITLFDVNGRQHFQRTFNGNSNQVYIENTGLSSGLYLLHVKSGERNQVVKLMID